MRLGLALVAVAALAAVPVATGALGVATGVTAASLRVDAAGNAQVSWTTRGSQRTVVVTAQGTIATGRTLVGADVSKPVRGTHVPFQQAIRSGPGGWYYALQARRTEAAGPMSLRFSRWRGVPTEASLKAVLVDAGVRLSGQATLDGHALPPAVANRLRAALDVRVGGQWVRVATVPLTRAATYAWLARGDRAGTSYRVVVPGPTIGSTLAPDAASTATALDLDTGR